MKKTKYFIGTVFLTILSACSENTLPKYATLDRLRVVGLVASDPEIEFDGTTFNPASVTLTPAISDLYGSGRALLLDVDWCLDPGTSLGAVPTCVGAATRVVVQSGAAVTLPAAPEYTGLANSITVDFSVAPAGVLALLNTAWSQTTAIQKYNGIAVLITTRLYVASDAATSVRSIKRILLSDSSKPKNANPLSLEIRQGSTEITALPSSDADLTSYWASSDVQNYILKQASGPDLSLNEELEATWFLTGPSDVSCADDELCSLDGFFNQARTSQNQINKYTASKKGLPTGRDRVLMVVLRDDRGGLQIKRYP